MLSNIVKHYLILSNAIKTQFKRLQTLSNAFKHCYRTLFNTVERFETLSNIIAHLSNIVECHSETEITESNAVKHYRTLLKRSSNAFKRLQTLSNIIECYRDLSDSALKRYETPVRSIVEFLKRK